VITLAATFAVEVFVFRSKPIEVFASLGLGASNRRALLVTLVLVAALLCFYPLFALTTGTPIGLIDGWPLLALGIFMQAGIAEEVLFRGFLFRHFREGRSFWHAALLSAIPFVLVHLLIFLATDFWLALAALFVSVSLSFPFAWLFERSGNSIWPAALLHAVVQGAIKLVVVPEASFQLLAVLWMILSALAPWGVFTLRPAAETVGVRAETGSLSRP
jgi:membrane protease YdiL (CAAX protease family)